MTDDEPYIDLRPAADALIAVVRGVTDDQLGLPTPCEQFAVGDLLDHLDKSARGLGGIAGAQFAAPDDTAEDPAAGHLGSDWRQRLPLHVEQAVAAWPDPSAWDGTAPIEPELPNRTWGRVLLTELVVHGWDLARATGQKVDLPADTERACLDHVRHFVPNAPVPQLWGSPVDAPNASTLDHAVAITGRDPGWAPGVETST